MRQRPSLRFSLPDAVVAPDTLSIRSDRPDQLASLYPWLEAACRARGVPDKVMQRMQVALEEVVMNAVMHGFAPGMAGEISIVLRLKADSVELELEDAGLAFDPTAAPVPEPRAALQVGGMGLTLLRHFCPHLAYQRVSGRNRVTLGFPLTG